jgi:PKD repeat protein
MTDLERQILARGEAEQVIQFNPDAALQKQIFADDFVPNSPEFEEEVEGTVYIGQRAEHLGTGEVRVYYVPKGQWDQVTYVVRPELYADFVGEPLSGMAPLTVQFTDLSIGAVESWEWDFQDDGVIDSAEQNPVWTYTEPGTYSVSLTVTGPNGNDDVVQLDYVQLEKPLQPEGPLFHLGVTETQDQPAPAPYSKHRYVDGVDGDDRNDGMTKPWKTLGYACHQAGEGVTVWIRPGVYNESPRPQFAHMQFRRNENYDGEVLIGGQAGMTPIIEIDKPDITFYNVHVSWNHARADGNWNWIALSGLRARLQRCHIYRDGDIEDLWQESGGQKEFGISVTGTDQRIIDCYLRGLRTNIAVRRQARRTTIYHCKLGPSLGGNLNVEDSFGEDHGCLIYQCDVGSSYTGDSIQFRGDASNKQDQYANNVGTIIRNCDIHHAAENCIDFKSAGRILVERNMIWGNIGSDDGPFGGMNNDWNHASHHMISCGKAWVVEHVIIRHNVLMDGAAGIEISGDDYYIHNNTFVNNNRDYRGSNQENDWTDKCQMSATEQNAKRQGIHFLNNISMNHADCEASFYLSGSTLELNGNCYHNPSGTVLGEWPDSQTWQPYTLPSWRTRLQGLANVSRNEENSFDADPMLVDVGDAVGNPHNFKLWPAEGSICRLLAVPLTRVVSASGNTAVVEDAGWFSYGFGVLSHVETVTIGGISYEVEGVDYDANKLYLDRDVVAEEGATVFSGKHYRDIGAYQVSR